VIPNVRELGANCFGKARCRRPYKGEITNKRAPFMGKITAEAGEGLEGVPKYWNSSFYSKSALG
jgi:hypothetical protein